MKSIINLIVALSLTNVTMSQMPVVKIGVEDPLSRNWKPLEDWLNRSLQESGFRIELIPGSPRKVLSELGLAHPRNNTYDGAILAPFRYVLARRRIMDLEPLARMRRPKTSEDGTETATDTYRSLLVMGSGAGIWPPTVKSPRRLINNDPTSTSGFIYPMAFLMKNGLVGTKESAITFGETRSPLQNPARRIWDANQASNKSTRAANPAQMFVDDEDSFKTSLFGIGEHFLETQDLLTNKSKVPWRKLLYVINRSDPIPFDVIAVRDTRRTPPFSVVKKALRAAFLSTAAMSAEDRKTCIADTNLAISDWVPARDEDYDQVRRTAVDASGGITIRFGISGTVHNGKEPETMKYLRQVQQKLLYSSSTTGSTFLDLRWYDRSSVNELYQDLDSGAIDVAEFSSHDAAQLLGAGHALLALAQFSQSADTSPLPPKRYRFLIVSRSDEEIIYLSTKDRHKKAVELSSQKKIAVTRRDSSSGFWLPIRQMRSLGARLEYTEKDRFVECGDGIAVLNKLLRDSTVGLGFLAEYEFAGAGHAFGDDIRSKFTTLEDGIGPSACLMAGKAFCPGFAGNSRSAKAVALENLVAMLATAEQCDPFMGYLPREDDDERILVRLHEDLVGSRSRRLVVAVWLALFGALLFIIISIIRSWSDRNSKSTNLAIGPQEIQATVPTRSPEA